jgi:hypothetical protein
MAPNVTVQRWEGNEGLPVHRHNHTKRGAAFAYTSEIQNWMQSRDGQECGSRPSIAHAPPNDRRLAQRCVAARPHAQSIRRFLELVSEKQQRESAEIKRLVQAAIRISA